MDKKKLIEYWLNSAIYDLGVAETLFQNKKFDWCLFIGHLVIEKVLKAFYVRDKNEIPPKIHNLSRLSEKTTLPLSDEQKRFLIDISDFYLEARYPEQKNSFYELCTKEFTEEYYTKIKELYQWLMLQMKQ